MNKRVLIFVVGLLLALVGSPALAHIMVWAPPASGVYAATEPFTVTVEPRPTHRSDCVDGGWKRYGFRNQGTCISYVQAHERAGMRPPQASSSPEGEAEGGTVDGVETGQGQTPLIEIEDEEASSTEGETIEGEAQEVDDDDIEESDHLLVDP
jgi:hypothetical protein